MPRSNTPPDIILCDADGQIVWLVGHRPDARFAITQKTHSVIKITAEI